MLENTQKFGYTIDTDNKTIILAPCAYEDAETGLGYTLVFKTTEQASNDMIVGSVEV